MGHGRVLPITVTEWVFDVVTLDAAASSRLRARQGFGDFWPIPATTSLWPAMRFVRPNGEEAFTTPSDTFLSPPPLIGSNAPDPPQGSWPKNAVRPVNAQEQDPLVDPCDFFDFGFGCLPDPWEYEGKPGAPGGSDEETPEENLTCPEDEEAKKPSPPEESPGASGNPAENERNCYNGGRSTTHVRLDTAINSFCTELEDEGYLFEENVFRKRKFDLPMSAIPLQIVMSLKVKKGCEWKTNTNDCSRYFHGPVDSCDCRAVNGK